MSLVHLEGFERLTAAQLLAGMWEMSVGATIEFPAGRTGNCVKYYGNYDALGLSFGKTIDTGLVIGFALKYETLGSGATYWGVNDRLYRPDKCNAGVYYQGYTNGVALSTSNTIRYGYANTHPFQLGEWNYWEKNSAAA